MPLNLPKFDKKIYHFGFALGANTGDFSLNHNIANGSDTSQTLLGIETERQSGFNLGIVTALHFTDLWSLRFIPALSFSQRNLIYRYLNKGNTNPTIVSKPIESTYLDFPFYFKFRSHRLNNYAAYLIAGGKYALDLASQQNVDNNNVAKEDLVVKISRNNLAAEVGFGFDFFLEYFKLSTEIKYTQGINNIHVDDGTFYSRPIDQIKARMLLFTVSFEG